MPLFNFWKNYNKPGPGVNKDEAPKPAPLLFFEIYGRKFTKLVQLNLIFLLPTLAAAALMVLLYFSPTHFVLALAADGPSVQLDVWNLYVVPLPLILLSPCVAGLTLVTRNFAREEHAFVWYDFWVAVRKNWKEFLLNGVVCYAAYVILSFALIYYFNRAKTNSFFFLPFWFCFLLTILFLFMQYYVPVMLVTFHLPFRHVYRNAAVFILAGLLRNLIVTVILLVLAILIFAVIPAMPLTILLFLLLAVFWMFSFVSFLINFAVYPVIDKHMMEPMRKKMEEEYDALRQESIRRRAENPDNEEDHDPYVYVNGKLVRRSQLKPGEDPDQIE